jgi:hypothetical protein
VCRHHFQPAPTTLTSAMTDAAAVNTAPTTRVRDIETSPPTEVVPFDGAYSAVFAFFGG